MMTHRSVPAVREEEALIVSMVGTSRLGCAGKSPASAAASSGPAGGLQYGGTGDRPEAEDRLRPVVAVEQASSGSQVAPSRGCSEGMTTSAYPCASASTAEIAISSAK
ncbi:hypothetical protein ACQP2T_34825 [Nonomuraea sp. CA-143628]|uniref:hypothetical protein n=1 Tax=Nonomuraea sp. CA-143628 TaxID=3239997 RepID=UPI003D94092D